MKKSKERRNRREKRSREEEGGSRRRRKRRIRLDHILIWLVVILLTAAAILFILNVMRRPVDDVDVDALLEDTADYHIETETETEEETNPVPMPDIDEQLLTVNEYSRPGTKTESIDYVVIHYLGNPKTTAQQNHDYFESLKDLQDEYMSANFIVGIEGEIIECVPPREVAYASNSMNDYSISIENCHLDDTGRFTEETYNSLVHLTAYLVEEYGLDRENIIRHYDVTGKECPLYYVENEDKWEEFKDDVMNYIAECRG